MNEFRSDGRLRPQASESHVEQIAAVEVGLRPAYGVKGAVTQTWTLEDRMRHYKVPGVSIAVAIDGELAWARAYGVGMSDDIQAVNTDTLFQAASLSKPIASLAALKLVEEGKISLDAPVNDYLVSWKIPDNKFTDATPVTLRHLMSHRAGTTIHGFKGYKDGAPIPTLPQILDGEAPSNTSPVRVMAEPGSTYRYSGGGYTIIQLLIEDVTHDKYANVVGEKILAPANMKRSNFDYPPKDNNFATGHVGKNSEPITAPGIAYPELAAAGVWTTPTELVRLGSRVAQSRNAGNTFLRNDLAVQLVPPSVEGPGLGFGLNNPGDGLAFVHNGHNPGYSARWINYADGRASVAILTNADSGGDLIREILSAVGHIYGWKQDGFTERAVVDLSSQEMMLIAGDYVFNPEDKDPIAKVTIIDNSLWISGPIAEMTRFYPASRNSFFISKGLNFTLERDVNDNPIAMSVEGEIRLTKKMPN
ncbi:MAG: beta-lactamase family protein [Alphaproteobacteria bacterium]|nr:beta-lactamase family protein [Alphaproteobacteria bacterium]